MKIDPKLRKRLMVVGGAFVALILFMVVMNAALKWPKFDGTIKNYVELMGDKSAPPTRWYNHWYLASWGWKKAVMIEVKDKETLREGYRVGFRDWKHVAYLDPRVSHSQYFIVKVGHEDVTFFAVEVGKNISTKIERVGGTYADLH